MYLLVIASLIAISGATPLGANLPWRGDGTGLTIVSSSIVNDSYVGNNVPLWLWAYQDIADHETKWDKNYTLWADRAAHACYPDTADIRGPPVLPGTEGGVIVFWGWSSPCGRSERIAAWRGRASMLIDANRKQADRQGMAYDHYIADPQDPALLYYGYMRHSDTITVAENEIFLSSGAAGGTFQPGALVIPVFNGQNRTVYIQPPHTLYGMIRATHTAGTFESFSMYGGVVAGLVLMVVAVFKYAQFWQLQGKISFTLPQIEIALIFLLGFVTWFYSAFNHWTLSPLLDDAQYFFRSFGWAVSFTCILMLGMYFREVATLTSATSSATLNRLKYPAIIMIACIWVFFIVLEIFRAVDPEWMMRGLWDALLSGTFSTWSDNAADVAQAAFYFAVIIFDSVILLFGGISLIISISSASGSRKGMVVRIAILTGIVLAAHLCFGVTAWVQNVNTNLDGNVCLPCTFSQEQQLFGVFFPWIHHLTVGLALLLNFRVNVSKEIEISKSAGTSSTSGSSMSSGSSSSSASSSSADPVIEL